MEIKDLKMCRLCLKPLTDNNYEIIENITVEMMDVLLMEVVSGYHICSSFTVYFFSCFYLYAYLLLQDFLLTRDALICIACFRSVKKLFFFKSMCLDVEECISQYIRSKNILKVDLREVYFSKRTNKGEAYIICHQKVCRFCLNLFENNALNEIKEDGYLTDVLKKHYPELVSTSRLFLYFFLYESWLFSRV